MNRPVPDAPSGLPDRGMPLGRHSIGLALSQKADASTGRCGMGEAPSAHIGALRYDPFQQDRQSRRSRIRE